MLIASGLLALLIGAAFAVLLSSVADLRTLERRARQSEELLEVTNVLERDPETADRLFRQVLELEPDPSTKSWSFLYLARLADSQGDRDDAAANYRAALAVQGLPDTVKQAAEKGLREAFIKK